MKKIYLLLSGLLPIIAFAQPTITQSDLPGAGLEIRMAKDTAYHVAVPGGGTNQTWNYASWTYTQVDTTGFVSATGTPYAGLFPLANLATYSPSSNTWEYFISNSSGFASNGARTSSLTIVFNPAEMYFPVPFTYGSHLVTTARAQIDTIISLLAYRQVLTIQNIFDGDAYGTLNIPGNSISNVLRMKRALHEADSTFVNPGLSLIHI